MATIYTPQNASPKNETRDMSLNQIFSATVDGIKYTDYQLFILKVSDNSVVYNSTKLPLSPNLADGEILSHSLAGGTIANSATISYKWKLQVWNGAETVTTREFQFTGRTTPILTFTVPNPITTQSYEFIATLAQAEGDIVNNYIFYLYDTTQSLIESSGLITNFNIDFTFDGFSNGDDLYIRVVGTTTGNQTFDSGLINFGVTYLEPQINLKPDAIVDNDKGIITVTRGEAIQVIGTSSGTINYVSDFPVVGMNGLNLVDSLSSVSFDVNIPIEQTLLVDILFPIGFEGRIIQLDNGAFEFGYEAGHFYYSINSTRIDEGNFNIDSKYLLIVLLPTEVRVIELTL